MDFSAMAGPLVATGQTVIGAIQNKKAREAEEKANKLNRQDTQRYWEESWDRQQYAWQRDDNAVQRRVADLEASGLSPLLAAGSAAQNANIINSNPQPKTQAETGKPELVHEGFKNLNNSIQGALDRKIKQNAINMGKQQIEELALHNSETRALQKQKFNANPNYYQDQIAKRGVQQKDYDLKEAQRYNLYKSQNTLRMAEYTKRKQVSINKQLMKQAQLVIKDNSQLTEQKVDLIKHQTSLLAKAYIKAIRDDNWYTYDKIAGTLSALIGGAIAGKFMKGGKKRNRIGF